MIAAVMKSKEGMIYAKTNGVSLSNQNNGAQIFVVRGARNKINKGITKARASNRGKIRFNNLSPFSLTEREQK